MGGWNTVLLSSWDGLFSGTMLCSFRESSGEWHFNIIQDRPPYSLIPNHPSPSLGCQGPIINVELNAWKCWGRVNLWFLSHHTTFGDADFRKRLVSKRVCFNCNDWSTYPAYPPPSATPLRNKCLSNVYQYEGKPMAFIRVLITRDPGYFSDHLGELGGFKGRWRVLDSWQWRNLKKLFQEKLATPKH